MTNRQRLMVLVGLVISAGFLWIAFTGLNPAEVLATLRGVNGWGVLLGGLVYTLAMLVITIRWRFLLLAIAPVPVWPLYQLVAIGYMGNNVYPFRSGEVLRLVLLTRRHRIPWARATTTVFVERVFDGLVMLTFIIVPLLFVENTSPEIRAIASFSAPIFITALLVFFALAAAPGMLRSFVRFVTRFLPGKLGEIATALSEELVAGLAGLRSPRDLAGAVIASYLSWMIEASVYWIVGEAFGLNVGYPIMITVVGTVNLAGLLPTSPGQLGVFEFFASRVLMGVGVPETTALAYALLVHLVIWLPPTLIGFVLLVRQGLGVSAVMRARELDQNADAVTTASQPAPTP